MSSRFSDIWETDLDRKKGLFTRSLGLQFKQRKAEQRHATDDFIANRNSQVQTQHKEGEPDDNFGGKLCHPKMRAKLLFRSGEFNNMSWGYHLEQTAEATMKSNDTEIEKSFDMKTVENDRNGNYWPEVENISPVPFSDKEMNDNTCDTDSNNNANEKDLNGNQTSSIKFDVGVTDSRVTEDITDRTVKESLMDEQSLTEFEQSKTECDDTNHCSHVNDSVMEFDSKTGPECVMKDKPHEYDIWVTEVTHDCLTVTFMESPTERGFFKDRYEA